MMKMKTSSYLVLLVSTFFLSCSLAPGMHMKTNKSWSGYEKVYIDSLNENITVKNINENVVSGILRDITYKIGVGDQIAITIWGLPEIFPITNLNPDSNLRRVDGNGNIFFPYVGKIKAEGKTQDELRTNLTLKLTKSFNDPQLDVAIAKFNSQRVYLLGEVTKPKRINITDTPLSLSDALGQVSGLSTISASGSEVFVVRQPTVKNPAEIYRANLSSPSAFIDAGTFYLVNGDIIYVNARGTTRWNRVISQFFPFSSFLNSIDNLVDSD